MRVALLAPIASSKYSNMVLGLATMMKNVEIVGVVVRTPFSIKRIMNEFRRDGVRLLEKVLNKMILEDEEIAEEQDPLRKKYLTDAKKRTCETCRKLHIPCLVTSDHNSKRSIAFLSKLKPDVIAFTGGGLLRKELLTIPRLGVLNCHGGMLPNYRGMDVVEWPVLEGHPGWTGLTLHFMDQGVDTGPIVEHKVLRFPPGYTFKQFRKAVEGEMPTLMFNGLYKLASGDESTTPQRPEMGRQYYVMHPRIKAAAEHYSQLVSYPTSPRPRFIKPEK